jgi:hypothetical protein
MCAFLNFGIKTLKLHCGQQSVSNYERISAPLQHERNTRQNEEVAIANLNPGKTHRWFPRHCKSGQRYAVGQTLGRHRSPRIPAAIQQHRLRRNEFL